MELIIKHNEAYQEKLDELFELARNVKMTAWIEEENDDETVIGMMENGDIAERLEDLDADVTVETEEAVQVILDYLNENN